MARKKGNGVESPSGHNGMTRRAVLDMYNDDAFVPPDSWTMHTVAVAEARRLQRVAYAAAVATDTPRRLGLGAPSAALSADKWLSKKITAAELGAWQRLVTLSKAPLPVEELSKDEMDLYPPQTHARLYAAAAENEDAWRLGKTVDWFEWWEAEQERLLTRRIKIATYATYRDHVAWGWRMVENLSVELRTLQTRFSEYDDRYGRAVASWRGE